MDKLQLLATSWTTVAAGYRRLFVPRFRPWVVDAIDALAAQNPPPGLVFAPGCGSGDELVMLAQRLPNHTFLGVDLAEGMIEVAREVTAAAGLSDRIELRAGDASTVPEGLPPLSAVFTTFALQQMPRPRDALAAWTRALTPGGVLVAAFWPTAVEEQGPWARIMTIMPPPRNSKTWEGELLEGLAGAGGAVVSDAQVNHEMTWPSVDEFWEGMTRAGPWYSRRLQQGDEAMETARVEFMAPGGGFEDGAAPVKHSPNARLLVVRRETSTDGPQAAL